MQALCSLHQCITNVYSYSEPKEQEPMMQSLENCVTQAISSWIELGLKQMIEEFWCNNHGKDAYMPVTLRFRLWNMYFSADKEIGMLF